MIGHDCSYIMPNILKHSTLKSQKYMFITENLKRVTKKKFEKHDQHLLLHFMKGLLIHFDFFLT